MSIATDGWDLVYNMRFEALNRDLQRQFAEEEDKRHQLRTAVAGALGGGLASSFWGVTDQRGADYTGPATATVRYLDGSPDQTVPLPLRVLGLYIPNPGTGHTSAPAVSIAGGQPAGTSPAVATAVLTGISTVQVASAGTDYKQPVVTVTGGGGSGARLRAVLGSGGEINAIEVLSSGSGYTSAPLIGITDAGSVGAGALATAVVGLGLLLTDPGGQYTAAPTVMVDLNGGVQATVVMELDDFQGPLPYPGATALLRLAPTLPDTSSTTTPALAYATPRFASLAQPSGPNTNLQVVRRLLQTALQKALEQQYPTLRSSLNLPGILDTALAASSGSSRLTDLFRVALSGVARAVWAHTDAGLPSEVLLLGRWLHKAEDDLRHDEGRAVRGLAAQVLHDFQHQVRDPASIGQADLKAAADLLVENEVLKTGLRAEHAVRCVQADVVFRHELAPDLPAFFRTVDQLDYSTRARYNALAETVLEAALALLPERYSHRMQGIGRDTADADTSNRLDKVVLHTGAWQLIPGGAGSLLHMQLPVRGGYLLAGRQPLVFGPADGLRISLQLQLNWAVGGADARASAQELRLDPASVTVLGVYTRDDDKPLDLTLRQEALLLSFIQTSINRKQAKLVASPPVPLAPLDRSYEYSHVLLGMNVFDDVATPADTPLGWMYPTTAAYAVADAREPAAATSVFSVCCMTEGRSNNATGTAFVNAIPDGSDASILIGAEMVCQHFIKAQLVNAFYQSKSWLDSSFKITQKSDSIATLDDFEDLTTLSFTNKNTLYLVEGVFRNAQGDVVNGKVPPGAFSCVIGRDRVTLTLSNVEFMYDDVQVLFSREQAATFRLNTTGSTKQFEIVLHQQSQRIVPQLEEAASLWNWKNLGLVGGELLFMAASAFVLHRLEIYRSNRQHRRVLAVTEGPQAAESSFASLNGEERELVSVTQEHITRDKLPGILRELLAHEQPTTFKLNEIKEVELRFKGGNKQIISKTVKVEFKKLVVENGELVVQLVVEGKGQFEALLKQGNYGLTLESIHPVNEPRTAESVEKYKELFKVSKIGNHVEGILTDARNTTSFSDLIVRRRNRPGAAEPRQPPEQRPAPAQVRELAQEAAHEKFKGTEMYAAMIELVVFTIADYYVLLHDTTKLAHLRYAIEHGGDNLGANAVVQFTATLLNQLKWPEPAALDVTSFDLQDSLVIGLRRTASFAGSVSTSNPATIMPHLNTTYVDSFTLSNLGSRDVHVRFLDGSSTTVNATQGSRVTVEAGVDHQTVPLAAFGTLNLANYRGLLVEVQPDSSPAPVSSQFRLDVNYSSTYPF